MSNTRNTVKQFYTEKEAAEALGISIQELHRVLDLYIFNDGTPRPAEVELMKSDLTLLSYWVEGTRESKVVAMPRR